MTEAGRAAQLLYKADKLAKPGLFGLGGKKYEEAAEACRQAANIYKLCGNQRDACTAFVKAAEYYTLYGSKHEAASCYLDAAHSQRVSSPKKAAELLQSSIKLYLDEGRFSTAARYQKEVAELYEKDYELSLALQAYQRAGEYYLGENSDYAAMQCQTKAAFISSSMGNYEAAILIFRMLAEKSLEKALTRWSFKNHAFCSILCHLCNTDIVGGKRTLEHYCNIDPSFLDTAEYRTLSDIIRALDMNEIDWFNTTVAQYDSVNRLDSWKSSILLQIKKQLERDTSVLT